MSPLFLDSQTHPKRNSGHAPIRQSLVTRMSDPRIRVQPPKKDQTAIMPLPLAAQATPQNQARFPRYAWG